MIVWHRTQAGKKKKRIEKPIDIQCNRFIFQIWTVHTIAYYPTENYIAAVSHFYNFRHIVIKQSYSIRVLNFLEKCTLVEWTTQLNKGLHPSIQGWLPRSFNGVYLYLEPNSPNHIALLTVSTQYSCPHWPSFLHLPSIMAHLYTCARTGLHCIWANQPSDTCQ